MDSGNYCPEDPVTRHSVSQCMLLLLCVQADLLTGGEEEVQSVLNRWMILVDFVICRILGTLLGDLGSAEGILDDETESSSGGLAGFLFPFAFCLQACPQTTVLPFECSCCRVAVLR